ncbi:hypothetical protein BDN71DRAFT_1510903 [Pleurotus eryngii]|uniref:Uncharacterized protein n=1 Tax=Pleurotus eryngii TaxID=5323 RepID=A0A9P5ZM50_PLEER|nr:hypothetical protein BDN71DRAFT_1510903 [Pleurotus eryngii]
MLTARNEKVCEEVGTVLREACESVHDILHDPLEEVHELAAAAKIVDLLDQSCAELLEILRQGAETAEAAWDRGVREAGDSRPRTSTGEEYEVVGVHDRKFDRSLTAYTVPKRSIDGAARQPRVTVDDEIMTKRIVIVEEKVGGDAAS